MTLRLVFRELMRARARCLAAVAGVAVAAGALIFASSAVATNSAQGVKRAERIFAPWSAWDGHGALQGANADLSLGCASLALDWRPDGKVLQGPPMLGNFARSPQGNIYANAKLSGSMPDDSSQEAQVVVSGAIFRRGMRLPAIGDTVALSAPSGSISAKVTGILDFPCEFPRRSGFPSGYMNLALEKRLLPSEISRFSLWKDASAAPAGAHTLQSVAGQFATDRERNFGRADLLFIWGAILVALALAVNTLSLSLDANRAELAYLRIAGMSRAGFVKFLCVEALMLSLAGWLAGLAGARAALQVWVGVNSADFPEGLVMDGVWVTLAGVAAVAVAATLLMSRKALGMKVLDALATEPTRRRKRRFGMAAAFGAGFAAFVAVYVWGESLMKSFVPSQEWPDAIVSILPGVSAGDIAKLSAIEGVKAIGEIQPFQVPFAGAEKTAPAQRGGRSPRRRAAWNAENALLIGLKAEDFFDMAPFKLVEGDAAEAVRLMQSTNACIITKMMADARGLRKGDVLKLDTRIFDKYGVSVDLPIAAIADLNWHMVTSRGKLRGLAGAPVMTEGPVFVSFDTIDEINPVPSPHVRLTHVWLNYEPSFLAKHPPLEAGQIVEKRVKDILGAEDCEVQLHARDEVADGTLAHGTDIIGSLAMIPYFFLIVLSIGFVAQLSGVAIARRSEFAALRAAGATRWQIIRILVREAVATAICGIFWGCLAGSAAGYLATIGTRSAMAHWGIPSAFVFPAGAMAAGALGAVLAAVLVAMPAAFRIVKSQ